eukprot:CAMPEP_0181036084 /NCGR_PEP_ID=MMETSP1070-20121207/8661_1 /TAXON_ID=265543 /ORGANISM="Minutocellus polymorphus, Strain NH13" /LENGTH=233 /DNA_ID=CAMNT_0023113673 /DNA_START=79 /DNA_END=780 /DNA_ORIENTATION=+
MGRSQVERNRRVGRPGSKGRGGGGRSATSGGRGGGRSSDEGRHHQTSNLSSNEWRYQEESNVEGVDDDVDGMLASAYGYAEHGPAHDDVASALAGGSGEEGTNNAGVDQTINLDDLARALRSCPTAELLDMPKHIAREYDKKYGEFVDEQRAKTISELRAAASNNNNKQTLGAKSAEAEKVTKGNPGTSNEAAAAAASDKEDAKAGGDLTEGIAEENENAGEEDLDAWLDSVI